MEKQPDREKFFSDLKDLIIEYITNKLEIAKLTAYEKIAKIVGVIFSSIVILFIGFITVLFTGLMGGFYFSNLFANTFYGFGIIAAFFILLFLVLLLFRKEILQNTVANIVIRILFEDKKNETKK